MKLLLNQLQLRCMFGPTWAGLSLIELEDYEGDKLDRPNRNPTDGQWILWSSNRTVVTGASLKPQWTATCATRVHTVAYVALSLSLDHIPNNNPISVIRITSLPSFRCLLYCHLLSPLLILHPLFTDFLLQVYVCTPKDYKNNFSYLFCIFF